MKYIIYIMFIIMVSCLISANVHASNYTANNENDLMQYIGYYNYTDSKYYQGIALSGDIVFLLNQTYNFGINKTLLILNEGIQLIGVSNENTIINNNIAINGTGNNQTITYIKDITFNVSSQRASNYFVGAPVTSTVSVQSANTILENVNIYNDFLTVGSGENTLTFFNNRGSPIIIFLYNVNARGSNNDVISTKRGNISDGITSLMIKIGGNISNWGDGSTDDGLTMHENWRLYEWGGNYHVDQYQGFCLDHDGTGETYSANIKCEGASIRSDYLFNSYIDMKGGDVINWVNEGGIMDGVVIKNQKPGTSNRLVLVHDNTTYMNNYFYNFSSSASAMQSTSISTFSNFSGNVVVGYRAADLRSSTGSVEFYNNTFNTSNYPFLQNTLSDIHSEYNLVSTDGFGYSFTGTGDVIGSISQNDINTKTNIIINNLYNKYAPNGNTIKIRLLDLEIDTILNYNFDEITQHYQEICKNSTGGNVFTFANGGQLINNVHDSACTHSIANNWANFSCGSNWVNYSVGAGEVWSIDACDACVLPYDGLILTDNTTICRGKYYEDDASNNGMLIINSDRITVNGNKSIIIGDSTGWGIYASADDTLRIENFTIINYDRGMFLSTAHHSYVRYNNISSGSVGIRLLNSDNLTAQSNSIWDVDTYAIELNSGADNCTLLNNTIINTTNNAIMLDININGTNIYGNRLYNVNDGIFLDRNSSHNTINNNSITKTDNGAYGIHTEDDSSYNIIKNNYGLNMGWNFVDLDSYNNVAYNNWMFNATHHVIDLCNNGNSRKINNNIVYNNFGQQTTSSGIYVCEGYNNNISNNTIIDVTGSGIAVEGNSSELNNTLLNLNSVHSADQYCLYSGSVNSFWNNNILSDCGITEVQVSGYSNNKSQNDNSQFLDNVESNGIMRYYSFSWGNALISINETSTQYHLINFSNGATAKYIGNFTKDITITNTTYTTNSFPTYNLMFNSSYAPPRFWDRSTALEQTISTGERTFIMSLINSAQVRPQSIAKTITDITYIFGDITYWTQTGTGDSEINVTSIIGNGGYIKYNILGTSGPLYTTDNPFIVSVTTRHAFETTEWDIDNERMNSFIGDIIFTWKEYAAWVSIIIIILITSGLLIADGTGGLENFRLSSGSTVKVIKVIMLSGLIIVIMSLILLKFVNVA